MSAAPPTVRLLVCGAADRGDDGAALVAVATLLPILPPELLASLDVRRCGQLQVDDLVDIPSGMSAVVVDAAVGIAPGQVAVIPLARLASRRDGAVPHSSHALPVDQVVAIAQVVRGSLPRGSFVGIGGRRFAFGQLLTRSVRAGLPRFRAAIESEIARLAHLPESAGHPGRTARDDGPARPALATTGFRTLDS